MDCSQRRRGEERFDSVGDGLSMVKGGPSYVGGGQVVGQGAKYYVGQNSLRGI
jgi:hypothetical protein